MKWRNCKDWWGWWNWDEFIVGVLLLVSMVLLGYLVQLRWWGN